MSTDSGVSCLAPAWLLSSDPRVAGDNRRSLRILLGGRTGEGAYTLIVAADAAGCNPHRGPCRRGSGGAAVVLQKATQARLADDVLDRQRRCFRRLGTAERPVALALMGAFSVVVVDILRYEIPQMSFAQDDEMVQAFPLDAADKTLGDGIEVGRAQRQPLH